MRGDMHKLKFVRVAFALMLAFVIGAALLPGNATAAQSDDEGAFVRDINSLRASRGLGGLVRNGELDAMARGWANRMVANGQISHNPSLSDQAPRGWRKLGENVGVGGSEGALFDAFVKSPGHYANLVDASFNQVGVAVVYANGRMWTVHVFMAGPTAVNSPAVRESEASRYLRQMSSRMPAAQHTESLIGRTATGR